MSPDAAAKRDAFFAAVGTRPLLMGIVNITPDSFSDAGRFVAPEAAIAQAQTHAAAGADIVDVGAESTRPGHVPVSEAEELARLQPTLTALVAALVIPASIDTTKAAVARVALAAGAAVVNDQWGLQGDPAMARVVADGEAGLVVMHNRDRVEPELDVLADIRRFFDRSLALAEQAGIPAARIILDPGVGFGKTKAQNLQALAGIDALRDYGLPVLVGVSRKSLFAALIGASDPGDRLIGTIAANCAAAARGAAIFRVHDCAENHAALTVFDAVARAGAPRNPR